MMKFAGNLRKQTDIYENRLVVFLQKIISVTIRIIKIAKKVSGRKNLADTIFWNVSDLIHFPDVGKILGFRAKQLA
jgi:hypothetical protein